MRIRISIFFVLSYFYLLNSYAQEILRSRKIYESEQNTIMFIPFQDSLFIEGKYEQSLQLLHKDIAISKDLRLYRLASCYAKLGFIDTAFLYLHQYIDISQDDRFIIIDENFDPLREDTMRWNNIVVKIERLYLKELDSGINKKLALELFYMGIMDQKYRAFQNYVEYSEEKAVKENEAQIKRFIEIIAEFTFPGISKVGLLGSTNAFFIYQHLHPDLLIKYYPIIKQCYQRHDIMPWCYAMATDRYLTWKNKKQLYGTQLLQNNKTQKRYPGKYVLWPVDDFKHVNDRRKAMGFNTTVEENIARFPNGYIPPTYYQGKGKVRWVR